MEIPQLGFGTYLANDPAKLKAALHYAIEECGVRHIDTAFAYFNQNVIGEVLKEIFAKGKIKREDMFITTKLWCTHWRKDLVEAELRYDLSQLQLDYVDLYIIHQPISLQSRDVKDTTIIPTDANGKIIIEQIDVLDTYHAMEECVKKGLTRHIGVSNFSIEMLERIWFNSEIKPC
ncbi:oxidoreductase, aldo/keto reductase family protein [Trichomonas vaginalis G3]|uniref:Oxidoreductase, aldo/keto reductase family protein n=1 Tax=Trichomonas vaginalis (strain ATCC PRA-98 / G3) TaxID=412133 RepID=A2EPA1_TRIV3|nr:oxidoreductase protein [Trichomonas vaginalis G3]EAY05486.1 oxidoreductase, aldo/keto reductase family protein [Trichomonas vaginalis G3]KAI5507789.1 oxidoreductase protein [Trichomonas vaginalis G3]|eukprot:XP_001317709.1 oxidoreductase, aldo/keto reductase family protein [Trichomonas vaginalis G3]